MTPSHTPTASAPLGSATPDRRVVGKAGRPFRYTNCRPISHAELCAIFGDDPIDAWAAERIQTEEVRRLNWPRIIEAFCLAVAIFAVGYFAGQLLRGAL